MTSAQPRVVVFQPYIPNYRVPLFERLAESLARDGLRLELRVSSNTSTSGDAAHALDTSLVDDRLARFTAGRLHFRSEVLAVARDPGVAMVVIEQAARYTDALPLLGLKTRAPVGVWGHGGIYTNHGRLQARVRLLMSRRADWSFVYTGGGEDYLVQHGVPKERITVLRNTVDTQELLRTLRAVTTAELEGFQERYGLTAGATALFLGRVDADKDIEFLLASTSHAAEVLPGFALLIGGAGREVPKVLAAEKAGAPVRYLGRLDGRSKALALQASSLIALPSGIGLIAVEALTAGRPIVTRDNNTHGPEAEYLDRHEQSVWLAGDCRVEEYGAAVAELLTDVELSDKQRACLEAGTAFSIDRMAARFHEGVMACLAACLGGTDPSL